MVDILQNRKLQENTIPNPNINTTFHLKFRDILKEMDHILIASGLEQIFIENRIVTMGAMKDKAKSRHYQTVRMFWDRL
jgi:hypothetical protein